MESSTANLIVGLEATKDAKGLLKSTLDYVKEKYEEEKFVDELEEAFFLISAAHCHFKEGIVDSAFNTVADDMCDCCCDEDEDDEDEDDDENNEDYYDSDSDDDDNNDEDDDEDDDNDVDLLDKYLRKGLPRNSKNSSDEFDHITVNYQGDVKIGE